MHKLIKSSIIGAKKEIRSFIQKSKKPVSLQMKGSENSSLFSKGFNFVKDLVTLKRKKNIDSKTFVKKNKNILTKNNLRALFAFIFSDLSMDQIEKMLNYLFGDLSEEERENLLTEIIDHINEKEYGFLLKD